MYFNTFFFNQLLISFDFYYRIIKVLPAVLVFSLLNQYPVAEFFASFATPLSLLLIIHSAVLLLATVNSGLLAPQK